jgi:hypothetical protein
MRGTCFKRGRKEIDINKGEERDVYKQMGERQKERDTYI